MTEEDISDIVETLRECADYSRSVDGDYYADQFATDASVFDDAAEAIQKLRDEIIRLRLTDAEREAVERVADRIIDFDMDDDSAALRGLLERLK